MRNATQTIHRNSRKLIQLDVSQTMGPARPYCGFSCRKVMTLMAADPPPPAMPIA